MPPTIEWLTLEYSWACLMGIMAGAASMLLYARVSPQEHLKALKLQCADLQQQLSAYEGDFSGAMALTGQNLRLTFRRFGCALWPSLIAGLPVVAALFAVGEYYCSYFLATIITAIVVKYRFKIA